MNTFEMEIKRGERFQFGKNWQRFLSTFTDERIRAAESSIKEMLRLQHLGDRSFLDIGSGSGLFSLAARNLGASVHSFDYDPGSVECTRRLRTRFYPEDPRWTVQEGSVLNSDFLQSLGTFDIVYAWGVLHHTGAMWTAVDNAAARVNSNGLLFIALYNDSGIKSRFWSRVKAFYCSGFVGQATVSCTAIPYFFIKTLLRSLRKRQNLFSTYKQRRGMSVVHDWIDWLGGFPYEVATVDEVFHFLHAKGFSLCNIKTENGGLGNNEFVFLRNGEPTGMSPSTGPAPRNSHLVPSRQLPGEST